MTGSPAAFILKETCIGPGVCVEALRETDRRDTPMDLFEKCYQPQLQDEIRAKNVYPYFHALESRQDTEVIMEG